MNETTMLEKYRGMTYDALANAVIRVEIVVQRDVDVGAVISADIHRKYLRLMYRVLKEKEEASK